jgi:hypothetical protein
VSIILFQLFIFINNNLFTYSKIKLMKNVTINSLKRITTKAGKRRVLINGEHFIAEGQFNQALPQGLSDVNLIGSTIQINFFKKGEELINGQECTDDNMIVKDVVITPSMNAQVASAVAASILASMGIAGKSAAPSVTTKPEVKEEAPL